MKGPVVVNAKLPCTSPLTASLASSPLLVAAVAFFLGGGQWYHKQAAAEARMRAAIDSGDAAALEAAIQQCNDLGVPCGTATKVSWNECACIEQAQEQQQGAERERGGHRESTECVCM